MSKIKYSALVSDMRNKLNGSVLSKNRYGSYIRNKVTPVNPQTPFQQAQRAALSGLSSEWRTLTDTQRAGWSALAATLPRTDIFGDSKILAGNALYVALNLNLIASNTATISDPPSAVAVPSVFLVGAAISVENGVVVTGILNVSDSGVPAGFKLVIYATPSYSPGVSFVKNQFRYLGTFSIGAGEVDIADAYNARFGTTTIGNKASFQAAYVSVNSGQLGLPSSIVAIVTEID